MCKTPPVTLGRPFWRLWTSSALSNLADGIVKTALPLVAIGVTRSPTLIAGLSFVLTLPWLLFALHAGALADRLDRRRVMLGANTVRALLLAAFALLAVLGADSIWALYVLALGIGVAETLYDTSAQSILPQVVPRESLSRANGRLYAAEMTADQFVGPPVAGFLAAAGAALAFATPAGLWLLAVGALLFVRGTFRPERAEPATMRADIAEGLRFVWRHRLLRTFGVMTGVINFAANAMLAILVLYAVGDDSAMGLSEQGYGVLLTAIAAGSLLGSFTADRIERALGRTRSLALSLVCAALLVGILALTSNPFLIAAGFFAGGLSMVVWNVIVVSLRQRLAPDRLLGRVNSGFRLVAWGTRPLGAIAGGVLAEVLGLRAVFAVMALLILGLLAGLRLITDAALEAAEQDAAPS